MDLHGPCLNLGRSIEDSALSHGNVTATEVARIWRRSSNQPLIVLWPLWDACRDLTQ